MFYALNDSNRLVQPIPGARALCPACGDIVGAKCGEINVWHWAHRANKDCDSWAESETAWHIGWKEKFEQKEIVIEKMGIKHRADVVLPNGAVLELQHSSISVQEIWEREQFYERMAWLFDITGQADAKQHWNYYGARFEIEKANGYHRFYWRHARYSVLMADKPVFLDLGNDRVFFIKRLDWASSSIGRGHLWSYADFIDRLLR